MLHKIKIIYDIAPCLFIYKQEHQEIDRKCLRFDESPNKKVNLYTAWLTSETLFVQRSAWKISPVSAVIFINNIEVVF